MTVTNTQEQGTQEQGGSVDAGAEFERELLNEQAPTTGAGYVPPSPQQAQRQQQRQFQVSNHLSSFDQQISQLETTIEEIEGKQMDPDQHYLKADGNFDGLAFNRDKVTLDRLNRQLMKLGRDRTNASANAEQWAGYAQRKASDILRGNMRNVPEHLRDVVRRTFTDGFKNLKTEGVWIDTRYQTTDAVQGVLDQLFNSSVGLALRNAPTATTKDVPGERGLDDRSGDVAATAPEVDDGFGEDQLARDTYKSIMEPWQQRRDHKSKTLADVMREQREARNQK